MKRLLKTQLRQRINLLEGLLRAKCLECSCQVKKEVILCPVDTCPIHPIRLDLFQKNPLKLRGKNSDFPQIQAIGEVQDVR